MPFLTKPSTSSYLIYKEISKIGVIVSRNLCNQESVKWSMKALLRKRRLKVSMLCWKRALDILIQKTFELAFIPSYISLFTFHDERRVSSDPMTQGFVNPKRRLNIDQPNLETMLIESA